MCSQIGRDKELGGLNEVGRELGKAGGSISQALETQVRRCVVWLVLRAVEAMSRFCRRERAGSPGGQEASEGGGSERVLGLEKGICGGC